MLSTLQILGKFNPILYVNLSCIHNDSAMIYSIELQNLQFTRPSLCNYMYNAVTLNCIHFEWSNINSKSLKGLLYRIPGLILVKFQFVSCKVCQQTSHNMISLTKVTHVNLLYSRIERWC